MPFLRQWTSDQFISGLQHGMARDEYKKTEKNRQQAQSDELVGSGKFAS
jgi:hypothetical protein